ncbi:MAG: class I SAM-dependent RNA methyltransferase [Alphaproteobacteria bacterium]|nr:class I SAM-dependent RNA methyltransferase [Alphaproteobacteria bacterium]
MSEVVTVAGLGVAGDGIAVVAGERLFIPYAVPGDRLAVRREGRRGEGWRARIVERLADGPDRAPPSCRHFGTCGGCALQHLAEPAYRAWKQRRATDAVARHGLDPAIVAPLVPTVPGDRRRIRLAARRIAAGLVLGFNAAESHRIIEIAECPVAAPALAVLLPGLRRGLTPLWPAGAEGEVALTLTDAGVDVLVILPAPLDAAARTALAALAEALDLARLSVARGPAATPEPVVERRSPTVRFGTVDVVPPPAGFLQAGRAAERTLVGLVTDAVPADARVADLFAGCGTFSLALAGRARRVRAVDRDGPALDALATAARRAGLAGRVAVERRDLDRRPLGPAELADCDTVILDPPRAGAAAQAEALARSRAACVVYVSCNPATFARDAAHLAGGGLRAERVTPVDQFLWSPHVELVAVFRRSA